MDSESIKYPIYIISKGRWNKTLTANIFKNENIEYKIAVEPQEYEKYCESLGENSVLKLDFSNLGLGSFPARNFCWKHSIKNNHEKHFIFDDNIYCFSRLNNGKRTKTSAKEALLCLQNFTDRYENIALSGFNYRYFVTKETKKPFSFNTHVYSGMLINNNIPFRWRLKYNEDVDLCLQALDKKWNTILLNAYLIDKVSTTVKMKGGNQDELYKNNAYEKKILKSRSLESIWPNYVRTVIKFGRPHHDVQWRKYFKHPLIRKNNTKELNNDQT